MDKRMNQSESSAKCRKILDHLFKPIKQKLDDNAYNGEGGSLVYEKDVEDFKMAYLETENLGPMISQELDRFLTNISNRPVEEIDKAAVRIQEQLVPLRVTFDKYFEGLERTFKEWRASRSDILKWLNEAPDNLVGSQAGKVAAGTTATAVPAAIAIGVGAFVLAPFTFGASLVAGAAAGAATVATAAGTATAVGIKLKKEALEANQKIWDELSEKLKTDNICIGNVNSRIEWLYRSATEISHVVLKVDVGKAKEVSSMVKVALPTIKAVDTLEDMPEDKEDIETKLKEKAEELKAHEERVRKDDPVGSMDKMVESIDDLIRPLLKRQYPSSS